MLWEQTRTRTNCFYVLFAGMMYIDGAALVSFKGMCEGLGVILDGIAVARGEEKGLKYNFAMNILVVNTESQLWLRRINRKESL